MTDQHISRERKMMKATRKEIVKPSSKKLAFVQSRTSLDSDDDGYISSSCKMAASSLREKGYEVVRFNRLKPPPYRLINKSTPVKGSTYWVRHIYQRIFRVPYPNIDIPPELMKFSGRRCWPTTLGAVREMFRSSLL